jgi:hypothetical protein
MHCTFQPFFRSPALDQPGADLDVVWKPQCHCKKVIESDLCTVMVALQLSKGPSCSLWPWQRTEGATQAEMVPGGPS